MIRGAGGEEGECLVTELESADPANRKMCSPALRTRWARTDNRPGDSAFENEFISFEKAVFYTCYREQLAVHRLG